MAEPAAETEEEQWDTLRGLSPGLWACSKDTQGAEFALASRLNKTQFWVKSCLTNLKVAFVKHPLTDVALRAQGFVKKKFGKGGSCWWIARVNRPGETNFDMPACLPGTLPDAQIDESGSRRDDSKRQRSTSGLSGREARESTPLEQRQEKQEARAKKVSARASRAPSVVARSLFATELSAATALREENTRLQGMITVLSASVDTLGQTAQDTAESVKIVLAALELKLSKEATLNDSLCCEVAALTTSARRHRESNVKLSKENSHLRRTQAAGFSKPLHAGPGLYVERRRGVFSTSLDRSYTRVSLAPNDQYLRRIRFVRTALKVAYTPESLPFELGRLVSVSRVNIEALHKHPYFCKHEALLHRRAIRNQQRLSECHFRMETRRDEDNAPLHCLWIEIEPGTAAGSSFAKELSYVVAKRRRHNNNRSIHHCS
jgi:hypothetical protein